MYVLDAVIELSELRRSEMHDIERPIAYLAFQNAEINRDPKKKRQPFLPEDFYFYGDRSLEKLPDAKYGAAALELIKKELYPSWGLFIYKELKARAGNAVAPERLCLRCEDAIMLAPQFDGRIVKGMLIAQQSASNQHRQMTDEAGQQWNIRMPIIKAKIEATEEGELLLI